MRRKSKPDFFCSACKAPLTEKDISRATAIRRYDQVYCLEHFNELFPDECPGHPGTVATTRCSLCGRLVCENCIIELAGKLFCASCKPAVVGEFITGQPAKPPRIRRFFKPFRLIKRVARRFKPPPEKVPLTVREIRKHYTAHDMLTLAVACLVLPIAGSIFTFITFLRYRSSIKKLRSGETSEEVRSELDRQALAAAGKVYLSLFLALAALILWIYIIYYIFFSGTYDPGSFAR